MKWDEVLETIPSSFFVDKKYEYLCDNFIQMWLKQGPLTCNQVKKPCSDWYIDKIKVKYRLCQSHYHIYLERKLENLPKLFNIVKNAHLECHCLNKTKQNWKHESSNLLYLSIGCRVW